MMWHTHLAFGFLFGLLSLPFVNEGNVYIFFAFVLLGALLPDIDKPESKVGSRVKPVSNVIQAIFGHRGIIHTIWGMIVLCGLFWYFVNRTYGVALFAGFFSHLLIDGFTRMGINFLHPIAKLHLSGFIETGTISETILLVVIIALSVILLI
ncbi:metal-dependent hydrolase [Candidatus Woesearchaeota archaeon]|nr:metal-dependent hydrolase [Candidatus Woesearchaeota archaeon]